MTQDLYARYRFYAEDQLLVEIQERLVVLHGIHVAKAEIIRSAVREFHGKLLGVGKCVDDGVGVRGPSK